ncbi:MAG: CPBP family intramembrane glutamic endopeptidase [Planctomycetota bacterium]
MCDARPPDISETRHGGAAVEFGGHLGRGLEFFVVFMALPAVLTVLSAQSVRVPLFPVMWLMAGLAVWILRRDPTFDRQRLWNAAAITRGDLAFVLGRFVVLAAVLGVALWFMLGREFWGLVFPSEMFYLPRYKTGLWTLIFFGYPLLSVLPQNVVWRVFLMHRYRGLFGDGAAMVAVSALAFGAAHAVMLNWFAVATTLVGGVFFAQTYRRSGSMLLASIEHALYGLWMFTVGYGLLFLYRELPPEALEMMRQASP